MKQTLKKIYATFGLVIFLLLLTAVSGIKADAATLKNGKAVGPILATTGGEYHKLVMAKDGYVKLAVASRYQDYGYKSVCKVSIHNASKKKLSAYQYTSYFSDYPHQREQFFALKKGTYYVKITMDYPTVSYNDGTNYHYNLQNQYHVGMVAKYVNDSAGTKKSKATTIKLKSSKQGLIKLTDSASSSNGTAGDWYKFKLKKATKVRLYSYGYTTDRTNTRQCLLRFSVYGKTSYSKLSSFINGKTTTLPKGTYYIRVYKGSKTDSGFYKIGLNKKV